MSAKPFAVRIFLQDGTVDGVKIVAKSKWTGRAILIPRALLSAELERPELNVPGVYILFGPEAEGRQAIAIGSAALLSERLRQAAAESDFWRWVLVSNAKKGALSLSTIQYIEARLLQTARAVNRASLEQPAIPDLADLPDLTPDALDAAEAFFEHLIAICPVLGLRAFEPRL